MLNNVQLKKSHFDDLSFVQGKSSEPCKKNRTEKMGRNEWIKDE